MRPRLYAVLTIGALAACQNRPPGTTEEPPPSSGTPALHVRGNQLVDATARPVRLRARLGLLRRSLGLRVRRGDGGVASERRPRAAQRDLLARHQRRHPSLLG